ncbi:hypothetical protein [Janthinobacterium sp. PAMC25594]|uniref:hypothetical protein n=1 Tax=Janthinobacterium sp. PAMC25594 TaxID=2861284 RepID=UPI001C6380CF|nr:hypothetical protein [Janthinobacterium sp. PAMC25594]QYG08107.1 hypothetical protein KY494_04725 [Janthinobacterium sp. PAMC25594]
MIDLLDLVRSIAAAAARAAENKHSPSPCSQGSPLLAIVRQACVERGYTGDGLAVLGMAAPTAQPAAVPDGWKLVPAEPNDAMQTAGAQAVRIDTTAINKIWTGNAVFRAMIAAAPAAPAIQGEANAHAVLYAALDLNARVVYSHESLENVEMNSGYIKTPTRVVGLAAIAVSKADGSAL